jgi:5-formyltetrahydrofolate cyclo-ligase
MTRQMIYHNDLGWIYDPVEGSRQQQTARMREEKKRMRKQIRKDRRALDPTERKLWDASIEAQVLARAEYQKANTVFCFVSYGGEPETRGILEDILRQGKQLAVPRCMENGIMEAVLLNDLEDLESGMYGIMEPKAGLPVVAFKEIDFAVVPALAFTPDGERLGQGGGYYDRFMAETSAFTCGICYRQFVVPHVPVEHFDQKVQAVVCEIVDNA